ncbi:hypothetical protein BGZ58_007578 [Dissophora ornata]|nr:hypothetical protein BGZ58_007578 [Dissophora ornata]
MATLALASGIKQFLQRHLTSGHRSPGEVVVIAALGILLAAIAKYPDRALFVRARPDLKSKAIKGYPLLGNLPQALMASEHPLLVLKRGFETYGDLFTITVPIRGRLIMINSPELLEHIQKTNFSNYIKGEVFSSQVRDMLGGGIFVSDGDLWRLHRKTANNMFTTKMYREMTGGAFTTSARDLCEALDKSEKLGQPIDLQQTFLKLTMDAFGKMTFGIDVGALKTEGPHEFGDAFDYMMECFDGRIMNPFWPWTDMLIPGKVAKINKSIAIMDRYAYETIHERRKESAEEKEKRPRDLLDHFINLTREDGTKLSDLELRDVFVNFMMAGRDSTGYTLTWQFYILMSNPRILKNVMKELDIVLKGSGEYTYETILQGLPYLKAVFYETLRLYPSVARNIKETVEDDVLPDGTAIYKGEKISFSTWCMGRNRSVWGEDAELVVPERWLADEDDVLSTAAASGDAAPAGLHGVSPFGKFRAESQFKFNSFNASPRLCIGQTFATLEAMVTTCMALQNFDLKLVPGQPLPELKPSVTIPMLRPLLAYATRKSGDKLNKRTASSSSLSSSYVAI